MRISSQALLLLFVYFVGKATICYHIWFGFEHFCVCVHSEFHWDLLCEIKMHQTNFAQKKKMLSRKLHSDVIIQYSPWISSLYFDAQVLRLFTMQSGLMKAELISQVRTKKIYIINGLVFFLANKHTNYDVC